MGWTDTVKKFFSRDTTGKVTELARGSSGESSMPNMVPNTPDSGMGGAYQQLATMLSVDADLMLRYADYENMDDYGEISCLAGSSLIFTLEDGWVAIRDLAERGGGFWVLSYDREMRSLVPAWATGARCTGDAGHGKPMVRVVIDDGRVITCTADHLFLTKHGEWVRAGDLGVGDRLMPGALRMRSLNVDATAPYWQVHQPHSDSALRSSNGMRWMFLHRLVAECGVDLPEGAVVHHVNGDSLNNDPKNLSVEDISSHAHHHIAGIDNSRYFPDWTPERRAEMAKRMCGNTYRRGTTCSAETRERMSAARRGQHKDARWRERIGIAQPNRIDIPEDRLEAALREGGNVAEAARILGVSWSKAKRAAVKADLLDVAANHRVLRVERVEDRPAVYDIEVPKIHNFVCDGVVVHNSALDIYADDATVIDTVHNKVIWGTSKDKIIRDIIDDLLHRRIRIEEDIWSAIRTLSKYGNLYCLPGGTRVWTDQGPRAIETIEAGTMVQGYKAGKKVFLPVARRLDNGVREIFRVRTRHREFLATADHPVLVDCGNGVTEWVQVGNLRVVRYEPSSDRKTGGINYAETHKLVIATSCHEAAEAPLCRDLFVADVHPKERETGGNVFNDFCAPERMDPWLCRLLGFMYGDGGLATERMDVSNSTVWLCRKEYEDRNEYYEWLLRRLHLEPNPNDDGTMTLVHSVLFKCFLLSLGWKNGSGKKRLPLWLGRLPREHRLAFLDGFMDADGWTTDPPTWTESAYHFEINNIELARDLKCLIDGLGFRSGNLRFRTREAPIINGKQVQSVQESAMLTFSRHEFGGDFVSETLLEVEPAGQAQVYDLEIADDAHNFVAEGVVVHNCEIVMNETGVLGLNWLPPPTMRRIIDARGNLVGFVQDPSAMFSFNIATREDLEKLRVKRDGSSAVFFYPWEVVHWRLRGKQMRALYGYSLLDSARWVWKRLLMLEDSSLVCKLTKSPARFAFYVDTGEMPPREARAMVDDVRRRYKKKRILDPATGKLDLRMNPMCLSLDTRIPLLNGTTRTLRDLIMDYEAGVQNYVYSMDPATKLVKAGTISWAGVTRRDAQVIRVTLDNCQEIIATPDHQFLMRDGTYKQAQLLEPRDSIMPLYRGINPGGYEYVVHQDHRERGPEKWGALVPVHRMVAGQYYGDLTERQVHHVDDRKRNNYPDNLEALTPQEHNARHSGEKSRRIRRWNKSEAHSKQTSHYNRVYDKGQNIVAYNRSPQHTADNAIRSEKISIKYPDGMLPELRRLVQENAVLKISDAIVAMRELPVHEEFCELNANRKKVQFDLYHARKLIHRDGYLDWQDFCASATVNHKIASVEWLDGTMDTGCITVDGWHNFAVDSGVFVKNSQDEDFFVPTRAGKDASRIEVLAGPDYDDTNVLQYFQKKLYAAIRIPPQYLGGTEVTNRASLTQEDVQFARLEMRIQREFVTGLSHVVRVHLAALNIDPDSIKWDLRMPTPSSIFEMQQIEVWNARVALAAGLRDFFTMPWIIANIFHMSDEDALFASEAKKNEDDANAMGQAQVQADIMQKFPELSQMPIPVGEVEGGQPQAESHVDVRREIRQALSESSSSNNEVLRLLHRMEPAISRVERRVRAVKTGS